MKSLKIKKAEFSNRKKQILVEYTSGKQISIHFASLGIKSNLKNIWVDKETNGKSVGIEMLDGKVDYMPYDQPLAIVKDPEFLLQNQIELAVALIKEEIKKKKISKRYLAEQLGTSDNQVQRLLNPRILNKNLTQLFKVSALLGLKFEIKVGEAA